MPIPEKTLERLQPYLIAFIIIGVLVVGVTAQSTGDYGGGSTQPSPGPVLRAGPNVTIGQTGNVWTISSTASGGGGGGDVFTATNNVFTATNSFLKPVYVGTNSTYAGKSFIAGEMVHVLPVGSVAGDTGILIDAVSLGGGTSALGLAAGNSYYGVLRLNNSGNVELLVGGGDAAFDLYFGSTGTNMLSATATTISLGKNGSTAGTFNFGTIAIPNGINIGSGQMNIPSSGAVTNTGGFFTTRLYNQLASNIVSSTSITPNRNSSGVFYVELTNNPTLNVPSNIRSGETAKIWLRANNITNTVTLASNIIIPTSSTLVSPFTIQTNTVTMLAVGLIGTNYVVEGYVPGYSIGPIQ